MCFSTKQQLNTGKSLPVLYLNLWLRFPTAETANTVISKFLSLYYFMLCAFNGLNILGDPGAVSGGGKKSKRARKKIGRRKVKNENRSPWDSTLNRPVPKPFKILACDWAQKYFCAQSESSSFRVTFVTSYSKVFSAKLFDRLFAIYLLARAGEFPSIEKCH